MSKQIRKIAHEMKKQNQTINTSLLEHGIQVYHQFCKIEHYLDYG